MKYKNTPIAIDFDGTCVTHEYPLVGKDIGAAPVLRELVKEGAQLILFTMRSGTSLMDAINWFERNGIPLWGVQYHPEQIHWTTSNKCYAKIYIDDAALGAPLKEEEGVDRPFIDWDKVREILL